jgi:hypothetical protein
MNDRKSRMSSVPWMVCFFNVNHIVAGSSVDELWPPKVTHGACFLLLAKQTGEMVW